MICPKCKKVIDNDSLFCEYCGEKIIRKESSNKTNAPSNNLVWAILCTVLCCVPLGLLGIIKASNVDSLWNQGRQAEAIKAANDAKKYSMIGIIVGVGLNLIITIAYVIMAVVSVM